MKMEEIILDKEKNTSLTAYIQAVGGEFRGVERRPAILVLPGGGYQYCSDREADPVAMAYLKAGFQVFILRYSVKEHAKWPAPLNDYETAMSMIRENADKWNLYPDKVAVIGFSAGGHLAACAAAMSVNRPNAAILGYPVILEETAKECEPTAPDAAAAVTAETCPCFIFATSTDYVVPIRNSVAMMQALAENGITFESHIYAYGPHGFTTADPSVQPADVPLCSRAPQWVADSIGWLRDVFGTFTSQGMADPVCPKFVNGDQNEYLSADCSLHLLLQNEEAKKIVMEAMKAVMPGQSDGGKQGADLAKISGMALRIPLRDTLGFIPGMAELAEEIDGKLRKIKNGAA